MKSPHLPDFILNHLPWNESSHAFWPISSFSLRRNLSRYLFPLKLSETEASQVFHLLKSALHNSSFFQQAHMIELKDLSKEEKQYLFEHFFISDETIHQAPHQAFIIDPSCQMIAGINLGDHLMIHAIDSKNQWHLSIENIYSLEKELSRLLDFSFHPRFGYLTQKPAQCGTALSLKVYLHLPAILQSDQEKKAFLEEISQDDYLSISQMKPLDDLEEPLHFYGDLVVLENRYSLGVSEDQMLRSLYATAHKWINIESTLRSEMKRKENSEFKDFVSRAFGILKHSYQMPTKDAIASLSYIKLGVDLGWITGITDDEINKIFFKSRKAHLISQENQEISTEDLLHKRAFFIQTALDKAQLTI